LLFTALESERLDVVKQLLEAGADATSSFSEGFSLLTHILSMTWSIPEDKFEALKLLLQKPDEREIMLAKRIAGPGRGTVLETPLHLAFRRITSYYDRRSEPVLLARYLTQ
jgi:ankyrin repeat protein